VPTGVPCSAGALIDRGAWHSGARASRPYANFFVNEGGARAADVLALIDCADCGARPVRVELREEIAPWR
jgi:UDP-N-acetylenolpyruvoylglucosamine reductase